MPSNMLMCEYRILSAFSVDLLSQSYKKILNFPGKKKKTEEKNPNDY